MIVKIGCCGFPGGRKKYYKEFEVAEVQETFYRLPDLDTVEKWRKEAPEDFEFTLKAWQAITHPVMSPTWRKARISLKPEQRDKYGFLKPTEEVFDAWRRTKRIAEVLKAKVVLIQCPASFSCNPENINNAREFFSSIDRRGIEVAWELRGNWLQKLDEVRKLCNEFGLIHAVDPFWDEDVSSHPISYLRLHGLEKRYNYRYVYTQEDLLILAEKLKDLERRGKGEVYVLFNNIRMRDSALLFKKLMSKVNQAEESTHFAFQDECNYGGS